MYYRVALYQRAIQVHPPPAWQWKSTVLSSLSALLQFLRLCRALPQDRCGCSPPPHGRAWRSSGAGEQGIGIPFGHGSPLSPR